MKDKAKALIEALKMLSRIALMSAIPVIIEGITKGYVDWKLVGAGALISVLKAIDEYMHELGTLTNNETLAKGLTRY